MFTKLVTNVSLFAGRHNVILFDFPQSLLQTQRMRVVGSGSDIMYDNKSKRNMPLLCYPFLLNSEKMAVIISSTIRCDENNK